MPKREWGRRGAKKYLGVHIRVEMLKGAFKVGKHAISDYHSLCSIAWGLFVPTYVKNRAQAIDWKQQSGPEKPKI